MAHQRIFVVFQYSIKDIADCFFATALTPELYSVSTAAAAVQLQSSMNHDHACHMAYVCSGKPWQAGGGSWIGHVLPGVFLVAWGLHWFVAVTHQGLTGTRKQPVMAAHHTPVFLPAKLQAVEPLLKVVLPAIAIILEFSLSGTRQLRCPPGSAKAGELDVSHMNSWSHAANYPPIILSGLVDLVNLYMVPLPLGVPHFFLSSAFGSSAFLMLAHTKGDPLDGLVHRLLGYCMTAVAVTVLAQGVVGRRSSGLDAAKSLALIMQGCWFFAITHIMFSSDATWKASHHGDMTRIMFIPVLFTWIFIGVMTFLLAVYVAMHIALLGMQQLQHGAKQLTTNPGPTYHHPHCTTNGSSGHLSDAADATNDGLQDVPGAWPAAFWPLGQGMAVGQKSWGYANLGQVQGHDDREAVIVADAASLGSSGSERSVELV